MPRYLPVQRDAANDEIQKVYDQVEHDLGHVPNFIKTAAHSTNFLSGVAELYRTLMGETGLSERLRQLAILKTCKLHACKYTVEHHTELAKKAGLTPEQIQAMDDYAASELFTYYEKEVLRLAEMVSREPDEITNDYWTQLDNHFTSDQIVELVALVSGFNMINRFILALQIEPDHVGVTD